MKKTIIALAVITASSLANADTKNFAGFNVGFGLDLTSSNFKATDTQTYTDVDSYTDSRVSETNFGSKQKFVPAVSLGYNIPLTTNFLIGLEGKFDLTKGPSSSTSNTRSSNFDGGYSASSSFNIRQKNHYSLAVKPGYVISDKFMVYGKVAYHKAKSDINFSSTFDEGESGSLSIKQNGIGFGAGMEYNLTKSMFLRAEIEQIKYKSKNASTETVTDGEFYSYTNTTSIKPSSTVGGITIGYRF